ncbi:hypothetical protein [Treponema denticola]|uniref:Uncharacterized protein n=1 Tax=Treponema denticola SP33 TaxID=999437 RepID=M2ATR0_TREDN|nr:hypothetical protein [Treponema denticola]EMB26766.1 hypothetical protein HMPREF9733_00421 [Treponema denticola SP33]EPF37447.1 hypothetical protein HMPREF9732_01481 [Treponema denticola SP32]
MSVTIFVHLNESENNDFDMRKFKKDIGIKYPGTNLEVSNSSRSYDLCWENYSEQYQFELRMDRKRCTFAIEYFNSDERIYEYARFILWLRTFFEREKEVILLDEIDCNQLVLSCDKTTDDIVKWLQGIFK